MPKPRPHAEMIMKWAQDDTLRVQVMGSNGHWYDTSDPDWCPDLNYRFRGSKTLDAIEELEEKLRVLKDTYRKEEGGCI